MAWRGIVSCLVAVLVVVFGIFAYYYLAGDINIPIQGEALWVVIIIGICLVLTVVFSVGMAWSVLRTCSPEDDKRPPTKAGKGHRGEPFHSDGRPTLVRDMKEIVAVARFVGLIEIRNGIKTTSSGTGFLVADGYLMSAYHVFKERIDDLLHHIALRIQEDQDSYKSWIKNTFAKTDSKMDKFDAVKQYFHDSQKKNFQQIVDDLSDVIGTDKSIKNLKDKVHQKWCKWCTVKFEDENSPISQCSFQPYIPFADEDNDVIILKLEMSGEKSMQMQGFLLDEGDPPSHGNVVVCGFLKYSNDSQKQLFLDTQCQLYTSDEKLTQDIKIAEDWWKSQLKTNQENISKEYYGCTPECNEVTGCTTMHTAKSFVHGTSGSPVILMAEVDNKSQPVVTAMYLQGYPQFYYTLQDCVRNNRELPENNPFRVFSKLVEQNERNPDQNVINLKYFFESGIRMQHVAKLLDRYSDDHEDIMQLRENIFRGKRSTPAGGEDSLLNSINRKKSFVGEHFHDKEQGSLSDKMLRALAKKIPTEWKGVLIHMEFPNNEIVIASNNYPRDVVECAFTCLQKWRNMNSKREDVQLEKDLIEALKFEGRQDVIEYLDKEFSIRGLVSSPSCEVKVSPEEKRRNLSAWTSNEDDKVEGMDVLDQKKKAMIEEYFEYLPPPLKVGCYDVLILCHEDEIEAAAQYRDHLNSLRLRDGRKLEAVLLEDAELVSLSGSILDRFEEAFSRSTFTVLFMSNKFVQDGLSRLYTQTSLLESINNKEKNWSILPVYGTKKEGIEKIPPYLKHLVGFDYGDHGRGKYHDKSIKQLVSDRCSVWKNRNDELQDKRYREALELHQRQQKEEE